MTEELSQFRVISFTVYHIYISSKLMNHWDTLTSI